MTKTTSEKKNDIKSTDSEAVTIIDVDRFIYKWDVSNTGCFDWSESVSVPNSEMPDLKISMNAPHEVVKIQIQVVNASSPSLPVTFRLKFLSASGIKLASKCEVHLFESVDPCVVPTFICKKDLYFGNSTPPCYKYTFICECTVSKKSISRSKIETLTFNSFVKNELKTQANFPSSLQHDFRELFLNKKHSDVKLRVGRNYFLAHKAVLTTRSPVFSAMFDHKMLENHTGVVEIEDMGEKTLQDLLEFMYTDVVNAMDCERALKLLLAADKYQVFNLKDKCTSLILSLITVENVCEVAVMADMISHESLKTFALNFIFANVSKVLSTPSWCPWVEENVKLAAEILCKLSEYLKRGKKD